MGIKQLSYVFVAAALGLSWQAWLPGNAADEEPKLRGLSDTSSDKSSQPAQLSPVAQPAPGAQPASTTQPTPTAPPTSTTQPAPTAQSGTSTTGSSTQPAKTTDTRPEGAPGADAIMTPDLLLVSPASKPGGPAPLPLKAFVGKSLTLKVEKATVKLGSLRGITIDVDNDTTRPVIVYGDRAVATAGNKDYKSVDVATVQNMVLPSKATVKVVAHDVAEIIPTGVTVGWFPTIRDAIIMHRPIGKRYGPDQARRRVEESRFGKRILWPHEKTSGIVYFKTTDDLTDASVDIPVQTLFDEPDATSLNARPEEESGKQ